MPSTFWVLGLQGRRAFWSKVWVEGSVGVRLLLLRCDRIFSSFGRAACLPVLPFLDPTSFSYGLDYALATLSKS